MASGLIKFEFFYWGIFFRFLLDHLFLNRILVGYIVYNYWASLIKFNFLTFPCDGFCTFVSILIPNVIGFYIGLISQLSVTLTTVLVQWFSQLYYVGPQHFTVRQLYRIWEQQFLYLFDRRYPFWNIRK